MRSGWQLREVLENLVMVALECQGFFVTRCFHECFYDYIPGGEVRTSSWKIAVMIDWRSTVVLVFKSGVWRDEFSSWRVSISFLWSLVRTSNSSTLCSKTEVRQPTSQLSRVSLSVMVSKVFFRALLRTLSKRTQHVRLGRVTL